LKQKPALRDQEPERKLERADALDQETALLPLPGHEPVASETTAPGLAESVGADPELDFNCVSRTGKPSKTSERAGERSFPPANTELPRGGQLFARFEPPAKRLR
jgi:hypothetical protein